MKNTIRKILVVDDEIVLAETLSRHLRLEGYEVETAYDGKEGKTFFEEAKTDSHGTMDLVITDINMPNLNGMELIKWLHEFHPRTSILVITGFGSLEIISRTLRQGVDEFAFKPLTPHRMLEVIHSINTARSMSRPWKKAS